MIHSSLKDGIHSSSSVAFSCGVWDDAGSSSGRGRRGCAEAQWNAGEKSLHPLQDLALHVDDSTCRIILQFQLDSTNLFSS